MFNSFNPKEKFDTIVMSNILEHVHDPILLLKKSRNWLNSGGIIIAAVPNAQAFHRKLGLHRGVIKNLFELTKKDTEKGHKRVYDRDILIKDFKKSGFKIIESGGIFFKLLSNKQMEMLDPQIFDALYEIGKELPDYCSSVYVCASKL